MDLGLKGKRVAITGSSRGLGFAIAKAFLVEGAEILVNGVNKMRLDAAAADLASLGRIHTSATDISSSEGVEKLFADIDSCWGGLDVLVNNAAVHPQSNFVNLAEADWDVLMNINLKAAYLCAQAACQRMRAQPEGGVILNAASFAALIPAFPYGLYSVSKAALLSLSQTMAAECAPHGIRVNAYVPGLIDTEMNADTITNNSAVAFSQIALGRAGTAEEVAWPVVFLASSKASYITGAALEISGGKFSIQTPRAPWDSLKGTSMPQSKR